MRSLLSNIQRPIVKQIGSYIWRPIMKKITFIGILFLFIETKELCEARAKLEMKWAHWSSQSEKTLLMSTAKHPGVHICQIYPGKTDD